MGGQRGIAKARGLYAHAVWSKSTPKLPLFYGRAEDAVVSRSSSCRESTVVLWPTMER